jgi:hypothetical protein
MDMCIANKRVLNQLIHEKNLILVKNISELSIKDKRKVFSSLRKIENDGNINFLFPSCFGVTIAEFCTIQVLLNDSKRKFKDTLLKQHGDMHLGLFETR